IELMSFVEATIQTTLKDTVVGEWAKQENLIGLERQYVEAHLEDVLRQGITQTGWSERIWGMYQKQLREQVTQLVRESMQRGYNPKKIARELLKTTNATRYQAERLMRTEQASVQAYSQIEAYKAQGIE